MRDREYYFKSSRPDNYSLAGVKLESTYQNHSLRGGAPTFNPHSYSFPIKLESKQDVSSSSKTVTPLNSKDSLSAAALRLNSSARVINSLDKGKDALSSLTCGTVGDDTEHSVKIWGKHTIEKHLLKTKEKKGAVRSVVDTALAGAGFFMTDAIAPKAGDLTQSACHFIRDYSKGKDF